jgi:hypothetical protein
MSDNFSNYSYFSGNKTHLASWIDKYNFRVRPDMIINMKKNIEIIVDRQNEIAAMRYDSTPEIRSFTETDGIWQLTEVGESYNFQDKKELYDFIANIPQIAMKKLHEVCCN